MNGNAEGMIAVARVIKAGFPCSRVDVTNAKYDAVVDVGGYQKLLGIPIKGTKGKSVNFIGGTRSGQQISRQAESRKYKYSKEDCYIIPVEDIQAWGDTKSLSNIQVYKENWPILIKLAKGK